MHHIGEDGIFVLRALLCPEGVRVEVEDHGPGISAEDLPYIFDRYYRSRSDAGKQGTDVYKRQPWDSCSTARTSPSGSQQNACRVRPGTVEGTVKSVMRLMGAEMCIRDRYNCRRRSQYCF